jgi:hypothetical protein
VKRSTDDSSFQLESEKSVTKPQGLAPNTKMYYTKVCFGIGTGTITGTLFLLSRDTVNFWLFILIGGLIACVSFVRYGLNITSDQVDQKRLWLSGTFTFVILFIVFTSLVWMIQIF